MIEPVNITVKVLNSEGNDKKDVKTGTKDGDRAGKVFTKKGKGEVIENNKKENDGKTVCVDCGTETTPTSKREKGSKVADTETQVDHIYPKDKGGNGDPSNGQVLCQSCNNTKSNQLPEDYYKPKN